MAGFETRRLVLVLATSLRNGSDAFDVGTGYFLTSDLVLTASHVVPEGATRLEVRTENDGEWREACLIPVWRDAARDAVLLRVVTPLNDVGEPDWLEGAVQANAVWHSSGYADAGKIVQDGRPTWKTVGLSGKLLAHGGGGQGPKELELTVESPPPADQWAGISGAPVFVRDRLGGIVTEVPRSFQGGRLTAVPISALLVNHGFRLALSPPWLEPVAERVWVLAVLSEAKKGKAGLADWVDLALAKDYNAIELAVGTGPRPTCVRLQITDALESPGRWLRFLTVLCAAPIAVFDATGFEPAVMLALGIRAVVRRGVTLTSSADELSPAQLSQLPFNIQETKLIHHGGAYAPSDVKHPLHTIGAAIKRGWQELDSQPHYLDLPAYDAVRGPYPADDADGESSITRMLVLCSFAQAHDLNWVRIANALVLRYRDAKPARMLDIASPRLVGQALYEGIRWARTCVVDWTGWRANVFFELGVRMAAADIGPVCVIEKGAADAVARGEGLKQLALLTTLIGPTSYSLHADDEGLQNALAIHDAVVDQHSPAVSASQLPHDATFRTCRDWFDWGQEHITMDPHEFLRASIEAPFGKDVQAAGRSPLLFSANEGYSKDLDHSVKERWLAAWFYITGRYPKELWKADAALRATVKKLGNDVLQFGLPKGGEPALNALRDSIYDALDELDTIDERESRNLDGHRDAK